jgi:hypothetical protein
MARPYAEGSEKKMVSRNFWFVGPNYQAKDSLALIPSLALIKAVWRCGHVGGFCADSSKANRNLTVTYALRWDCATPTRAFGTVGPDPVKHKLRAANSGATMHPQLQLLLLVRPLSYVSDSVLVHRLACLLHGSFRPPSPDDALALRDDFSSIRLSKGISPSSCRTCRAHKKAPTVLRTAQWA